MELAAEQCKRIQMAYAFNLMRACALYIFQTDSGEAVVCVQCVPVSASGIGAFARQATPGSAGAAKSTTKFLR